MSETDQPSGATPPAAAELVCPNCGAPRLPEALFCEACGYDYTTGQKPDQDLHTELGLSSPSAEDASDSQANEPAMVENSDAQASDAAREPDANAVSEDAPAEAPESADAAAPVESAETSADGAVDTSAEGASEVEAVAAPVAQPSTDRDDRADVDQKWVAELWIDPDWYALQQTADPMPVAGLPKVIALAKTPSLIGRVSVSRGIRPDVDCGLDTGCSRRQAELTYADGQWYVTDLGSFNGTFVAKASEPPSMNPIETRTPVTPDDRIYVGAWSRIVVRQAQPDEWPAPDEEN
jgi:hypothetical protein